ncbi:MAG TPA: protein kinase [Vicinamibacterales bacterium]|nr:protein kinase [Vicinamibacterales bacterium]
MAKKLRVGDAIRGYRVTKIFGPGMMAISYAAEGAGGVKVFLKQYKSPSPAVIWYPQFVDYQQELSRRVRDGKASRYAVRLVEAFEETWGGRTYFAAFELVANARDLEHMLEEEREAHRRTKVPPTKDPAVWARHVTWAKVFMAGIAALHESKVVHADLKPANALLIKDPTLSAGYELKLIDMDFSLLADRKAPWHGYQAYIGTDNYRSPEHMTRGAIPGTASDIFTSGLILYELLVGVHPYWQEDQAEYAKRVRAYDDKPPALLGVMPAPAENVEVSAMLHRCLSPDPAARPTAPEIRAALSGRAPKTVAVPASAGARTGAAAATPARPAAGTATATRPERSPAATAVAGAKLTSNRIQLVAPGGQVLALGIRTELGKALLRRFGADAEFWDDRQCIVERGADGSWIVTPALGTVNETLLNGEPLTAARRLSDGDVLAVGRSAKGISKLPLTARAG